MDFVEAMKCPLEQEISEELKGRVYDSTCIWSSSPGMNDQIPPTPLWKDAHLAA